LEEGLGAVKGTADGTNFQRGNKALKKGVAEKQLKNRKEYFRTDDTITPLWRIKGEN